MKPGIVLSARDPLLGDGIGDLAVTQQAGAHVMVIRIDAKDVVMAL
jgi:hypothetical protein